MKILACLVIFVHGQRNGAQGTQTQMGGYVMDQDVRAVKKTEFTLIPKGATSNTYPGYWLDGDYSTIVRPKGTADLRLTLNLHVPQFIQDGMFMTWHQFYDQPYTEQQNDSTNYYESFSYTI